MAVEYLKEDRYIACLFRVLPWEDWETRERDKRVFPLGLIEVMGGKILVGIQK